MINQINKIMWKRNNWVLFFVMGIVFSLTSYSQNPQRFKNEVDKLVEKEYHFDGAKPVVVFTGSSSIKMWKDIQEYFPDYAVINNGFGGSTYADLLYYYKELIYIRKPDILFIYEGDNDLKKTTPEVVITQVKELLRRIKQDLPQTRIVLITPKPSIARWNLKASYEKMNTLLARLARQTDHVELANVWDVMLDSEGVVYQDVFLKDNLHMNKKGYDLWAKVLKENLKSD